MHNKNNIILLLMTSLLLITGLIWYKQRKKDTQYIGLTIGILQTASHPALDETRNGFIETLNKKLGDTVRFIIRNAEGSLTNAHIIAEQFHHNTSIDAVYTIATPALQAMYAIEKEKPLFIAAVSSPDLIVPFNQNTNVYGITDMIDIPGQINAIKLILPHIHTIAILYNPAEANSIAQINVMEEELQKQRINTLLIGITSEAEIATAVTSALAKADALLTPTDNLTASAMPIISHLAQQMGKPLIASHNEAVKQGAFMARGVDYYQCGVETAEIALLVLDHKQQQLKNTFICPSTSNTLVINKKVMQDLHILMPKISDNILFINS